MALANPVVAVVGATGAVGIEFLDCFEKRNFPMKELRLLASARSKGKVMMFKGKPIVVEELTEESFKGVDIAMFAAGGSITKKFAGAAVKAGAVVPCRRRMMHPVTRQMCGRTKRQEK